MTCIFITEYFANADVPPKKARMRLKLYNTQVKGTCFILEYMF